MCMGAPDIPEPKQRTPQEENSLLIGDGEEDQMMQDASRRGTQGLQISLNSGASGSMSSNGGSGSSSGLSV